MSLSSPSRPKIFALPSELIEEALIVAAARGFPTAIAAFGSSCRHFHGLVYKTTDNHLWREIFLTTFDDPRPILMKIRDAATIGPSDGDKDYAFDWPGEFQRRINAGNEFRRLVRSTPKVLDLFSPVREEDSKQLLTIALKTIMSVLDTSTPFPVHDTLLEPHKISLFFPPLTMMRTESGFPSEFISRNSKWVDELLKDGYPPILVKKYLLVGHQPSKPLKVDRESILECSEEGLAFHRLVFRKGFLTIPSCGESRVHWRTLQSNEDQVVAAREVARSKVYNLRYLRPDRLWGPFLSASGPSLNLEVKNESRSTFPDFERDLSRYMLSHYVGGETSDSDDEEFVLLEEDDGEGDAEDDEDDGEDNVGHVLGYPFTRRRFDPKLVAPEPHEVKPDYAYLAATRILVEMNLRDILTVSDLDTFRGETGTVQKVIDALRCLELGRMGSATNFWEESWVEQRPIELDESVHHPVASSPQRSSKRKGKEKATEEKWIEGWDWAGVSGHWIRVVCWLDYRDLLLHNLHGYHGDEMGETIHFFPMDLRVAGYSPPPEPDISRVPPEDMNHPVWRLPVIHIEGESHGPHDDASVNSIRKIGGTVRMLRDGAIRWTLTSSYFNEDSPEWSTEGIQIGGIGSALGMLGMWTGADHASTDPLGPTWTWKIR